MGNFVETNGIRLHYIDYGGEGETIVLLHGLTANAHSFDGLINAGISKNMRVIAVDLRGRGLTDKPDTGYGLADHAQDILGLLDALNLNEVVLAGHSYGGRLGIYMAVHHREQVKKLILVDTGFFHPKVVELIMPSVMRLTKIFESWEAYVEAIKNSSPYHGGFWADGLETYYRADVETLDDGSVKPRSTLEHMVEVGQLAEAENWEILMKGITQPTILLHGADGFGPDDTPPIMLEEGARRASDLIPNCEYKRMSGNHMTMLFGAHALKIVDVITTFLQSET